MYALIAMMSALGVLVLALHLKVRLGRAMVLSAVVLAVILGVTPGTLWRTSLSEWHEKSLSQTTEYLFITLTALVCLVNVLGSAMQETGVAGRLAPALEGMFRSRRAALAIVPMMMGLLPTPGGIMLSAPMVRELADRIGIGRDRSAAINYMFRHQWETVWPLFPAVPLVQSIFGISAFALISHNVAIAVAGTIAAVIFLLLSGIPRRPEGPRSPGRFAAHVRGVAQAFWPIAVVAALYVGFDIPPAGGLLLAVAAFMALHKVPFGRWRAIFKSGFEGDFVLLIFGALLFKLTLEAGRAVPAVVEFLTAVNAPAPILIFGLPLLVAFLTGVTMPTVAITFPFLLPYIGTGSNANVGLETFAFSGLICGLMATPVHLCLALSASYFEAGLWAIIRQILWPIFFVAASGVLMAILST